MRPITRRVRLWLSLPFGFLAFLACGFGYVLIVFSELVAGDDGSVIRTKD